LVAADIYIGGAAGAHVRKGDLLATVDDAETAEKLTSRFLQYYRENGKWLERTYAFVPRVGLDRIKAVMVEGRCCTPQLCPPPNDHDDSLVAETRRLIAARPDVVLVTTGYGMRRWFEVADAAGLGADLTAVLQAARIFARGPKGSWRGPCGRPAERGNQRFGHHDIPDRRRNRRRAV
jgi:hypothetical protein